MVQPAACGLVFQLEGQLDGDGNTVNCQIAVSREGIVAGFREGLRFRIGQPGNGRYRTSPRP